MYKHTHGLPRLVNQLANLCLVASANARKPGVDSECLLQALNRTGRGLDSATERVGFTTSAR